MASISRLDLCFKSYRSDPLARLIIGRLELTPYKFALVGVGMAVLLYGIAISLYIDFHPKALANFLDWAWEGTWVRLVLFFAPSAITGFYCWISIATGRLFDGLVKDNIVETSDEELYKLVLGGKGSIEEAYNRSAWIIASVLVMVLTVVLSMMRPIEPDIKLFHYLRLPFFALQAYMISMIVAKEVTTIRSLGKFFRHTLLNLRPLHPDKCGGLRRLHDYAIIITYAIAVAGLHLCLASYLSFKADDLATNYLLQLLLGSYLILAPFFFFTTLGTAHKAMKAAKEKFLHNISDEFQSTYAKTQKRLTSKHGEFKDSLNEIEQLQTLHKLTQSFPVWPFDARSIWRFVVTIASPLISTTLAAVIDQLLRYLYSR